MRDFLGVPLERGAFVLYARSSQGESGMTIALITMVGERLVAKFPVTGRDGSLIGAKRKQIEATRAVRITRKSVPKKYLDVLEE